MVNDDWKMMTDVTTTKNKIGRRAMDMQRSPRIEGLAVDEADG